MTRLIVIGTSLGGLSALCQLLAALPRGFACPIAIAQHRVAQSDSLLGTLLQARTTLRVVEPDDKAPIRAGHVYLSPADYHLQVEDGETFSLSTDPPVAWARPSIDVLFESAASAYGAALAAVVLTGANTDGARGIARVRACGGLTIAQDPATAEAAAMPRAAIAAGAELVLPLDQIGTCLGRMACAGRVAS